MKPKNYSANRFLAARCLSTLTLVFTAVVPSLHAEQWNVVGSTPTLPNTVAFSNYSWNDVANWNGGVSFPNGVDATALFDINILVTGVTPNLQGTQNINLNVPIIVGNLTLGDTLTNGSPAFNGNGFYNISNGTAGNLTFEKSVGNATLQKTVGSGTLDTILATTTLTSPLTADIRTGTIEIGTTTAGAVGRISGSVGITRAAGVTLPTTPSTGGGTLILTNPGNTYTGSTIIEHGTLAARLSGDILASTPSNFGNSATPIVVGTAATNASGNGTSVLNFIASNDTSNYTVSRGLDLSAFTTGQSARQTINFNGNLYNFNAAGGLNTNTLTLSGPITIGTRNMQFGVLRSGMTMNITGDISGTNGAAADAMRFNGFPSAPNVDGRGAGTIRFSNLNRTFSAPTGVLVGTLIIDGVVGAVDTPSPIGQKVVSLSIGSGGNILGGANFTAGAAASSDTSPDTTRALFLESAGSSYARAIGIGNGSSTTAAGVLTPTTGSTAIPTLYGLNDGLAATDASRVNVINGFKLGGLNKNGTTTFSGNINSATLQVGNTNTNNTIDVGVNLALMSATGGTTAFTGVINDTSNGTFRPSVTRVTVNQFRNHPNLDGYNNTSPVVGADGTPDPAANALVGTATGGTVILSASNGNTYEGGTEVLGGTLLVNNGLNSGTGLGDVKVVSGAKLGGSGAISGSANLDSGAGLAFTVNTSIGLHDSFDFGADLTLSGTTAVTILDGVGAETGDYTLATVAGTFTGTPLVTPILPLGMKGTVSVVGSEIRLNVTEVPSAAYVAWIATFPTITGTDRALDADPDGDGQKNLQEFAFGLNPTLGSSVNPIVVGLATSGDFSYSRYAASGLNYKIFTSSDLTVWTERAGATQTLGAIDGNGVQTVAVTTLGATPVDGKLFVRVEAQ